jgi:hypothetical protein
VSGLTIAWYGEAGAILGPVVTQGAIIPIVIGPPGTGALVNTFVPAGQSLGGHRGVYIGADDKAWLADPLTAVSNPAIGITVSAALSGADVPIRTSGLVTEPSWNWIPGPIYLGAAGVLTQMPPSSGAIVRMGISAGPDRMRVDAQFIATI